jgi:hypothetical protein
MDELNPENQKKIDDLSGRIYDMISGENCFVTDITLENGAEYNCKMHITGKSFVFTPKLGQCIGKSNQLLNEEQELIKKITRQRMIDALKLNQENVVEF